MKAGKRKIYKEANLKIVDSNEFQEFQEEEEIDVHVLPRHIGRCKINNFIFRNKDIIGISNLIED